MTNPFDPATFAHLVAKDYDESLINPNYSPLENALIAVSGTLEGILGNIASAGLLISMEHPTMPTANAFAFVCAYLRAQTDAIYDQLDAMGEAKDITPEDILG